MTLKWTFVTLLFLAVLPGCGGGGGGGASAADPPIAQAPTVPTESDLTGLDGRFVMGYQGWFGCPGDFEGNSEWFHWFNGSPAAENITVDMLPATDALATSDLCETGLTSRNGAPVRLFSSQNPSVVDYHFGLMAQKGVGGVAFQRFVVELSDYRHARRADNVLKNVIAASEKQGVPFYLSYDVTGADPATVVQVIRQDWQYLVSELKLTEAKGYLKDHGKPVLQLWGFGFAGNPGAPQEALQLVADLKAGNAGLQGVTAIGGVPSGWRTLQGDSQADPLWSAVYLSYDVLSPWTVGRYVDEATAASYFDRVTGPDMQMTKASGLRYMPVIFPGFSWHNLMTVRGDSSGLVNQIPRSCGNFIWRQSLLLLNGSANMAYGAMFDELDEGTAMMPAQSVKEAFPLGIEGVYLNQDGCDLAQDWYVTVMGMIAKNFRDKLLLGTFRSQQLSPT